MLPPGLLGNQPPPIPNIPNLVPQGMRPQPLESGSEQMIGYLVGRPQPPDPDDPDNALPSPLRQYAAGLRPTPKPAEVGWSQELVFQRLGKEDTEIADTARFYFQAAQD